MTCVALISDIHGNLPALEAVAADIRRWRPDAVYVLGDMINGACWSGEVLDLISDLGWPMLIGNHDDAVMQLGSARMEPRFAHEEHYAALWWTRRRLLPRHLELLEALPSERLLAPPDSPPLRMLHGMPGDFFHGVRPDTPVEWAESRLAPVVEPAIAGGHTHVPMERRIAKWLLFNSGSVGVPYDGDVRAGYIRICGGAGAWSLEVRRIPYDLQRVRDGFRESGLAEEGGAMARMVLRSILTAQPWVADYAWWLRSQSLQSFPEADLIEERYLALHGPGHWSFPMV